MPDPKTIAGIPLPVADVARRHRRRPRHQGLARQQHSRSAGRAARRRCASHREDRRRPAGPSSPAWRQGRGSRRSTTVQGERLQSQEFAVPAAGGTRLLLVATDPDIEKRAAGRPEPGGGTGAAGHGRASASSRGSSSSSATAACRCSTSCSSSTRPGRRSCRRSRSCSSCPRGRPASTILKDSSPQATAADGKVTVVGPFAPGVTNVQFAYSHAVLERQPDRRTDRCRFRSSRVIVLAQKVADMRLASAQMTEQREMPADGQTYVVGQGPAVRAGERLAFAFTNLPHEALVAPLHGRRRSPSPSSPRAGGAARARPAGPVPQASRTGSAGEAARAALRRADLARGAAPRGPRGPADGTPCAGASSWRRSSGCTRRSIGWRLDGQAQGSRLKAQAKPSTK